LYRRRNWRGYISLFNLLKPEAARRDLRVTSRYGSQFYLAPTDEVDSRVISDGFYESEVLEAALPYLGPGSVLWVIGANFGLHAITAKWLHPETQVIAFEPVPALAARLQENCDLNGVDVSLHCYALARADGQAPFFANASGNSGRSTLHPVEGTRYDRRFAVATRTAAQVIESEIAPAPTCIILDAEGADIGILRGFGPHLLAPALRAVVFEAANEFLERREPAELDEILREAGFVARILIRNERTAHNLSNFLARRQ
jgi:FkbM family methyltransferase